MAQKIFFTRKTSLTFLFLLFLKNLNICCICCGCCYDDLLKKEYNFMWDNDSKEKYKDDFSLSTEKWKKKNKEDKEEFDIKSTIKRSFSFDKFKKKNSPIKKNDSKEEDIITQYSDIWKIFLGKKIYEYLKAQNLEELDIKNWKNVRNKESDIELYFDELYRNNLKNFVRFGLMIDPQIALEPIQNIVQNGELGRMFNAVLYLYDFYLDFEKKKDPSIENAFKYIEENWEKGKKIKNFFEEKYKKFEEEILNALMKHKEILCKSFWTRRKDVLPVFLSDEPNEKSWKKLMEGIAFEKLLGDICAISTDYPSKNEIFDSIKKIIISETFYKGFFTEMYEPLKAFFKKKQEEEKKEEGKKEDKKEEEKKEEEKKEEKKEEEKKEKKMKTLCEVGDLKLCIEKNEKKIYLDNFIVCLLTFKEDFIKIFEKDNKRWLKWLKRQYDIAINNSINKKPVFSEIFKKDGSFNGNLSYLDKYFCSMLCLLYEFLKADADDVFGEKFKKLRLEIANFFCQKKKIRGIESEFNIFPEDFYDTFFGFMATMYQKFLGSEPLEEELPKVSLKKEEEEKEDKEENKEEEKKEEKKEEVTVDFGKAIESFNKEKNLIKKTFGFYYIVKENDSFKLKHKFCCKVTDDYKDGVTFKDLLALYKKHKNVIRFFPQKNLILIVTCKKSPSEKSIRISVNDNIYQIENNKYCLKTILNPVVIKSYDKHKKNKKNKMGKGSSIYFRKDKDSSSGPSLTSPYDSLYKDITNIDKSKVSSLSCLWGKHISYFLSQEKNSAFLKDNISLTIEKIRDFYIGEKIDEFFAENEKPENKNNEKTENKNEENIEFKSLKDCLMFLKEHLNKGNNVPVFKKQNIDPYFKFEFYDKIKNLFVENEDFLVKLKETIGNCLNFKNNLEEDINENEKPENNDDIFFFIYILAEFLYKKVLALNWEKKEAFLKKYDKEKVLTDVLSDMNEKKNIFSGFLEGNGSNFESLSNNKTWEDLLHYNFFEKLCPNSPCSKLVNSWNNSYNNFSSNLKSFLINFVTYEVGNIFGWKTLPGRLYPLTKKNSEAELKRILSDIEKKTVENKSNFNPETKIQEIKTIIEKIEKKKEEIDTFLKKLKFCYEKPDFETTQFAPIFRYYVEEYEKKFSDLNSLFEKYKNLLPVFTKKENFVFEFFSFYSNAFCDMKERFKNIPVSYDFDKFETYSNEVINNAALVAEEGDEIFSVIKKLKSLKNIFLKTIVEKFVGKKENIEKIKKDEIEEDKKDEELKNGLKYKDFDINSFIEGLFISFFPDVEKISKSNFSGLEPKSFIDKRNEENKLEKIAHNDAFFGLRNEHQNCFLNALLQCLFKCSDIFIKIAEETNANDEKFIDFIEKKKKSNDNNVANRATFIVDFLNLVKMVYTEKKKYEQGVEPSFGKNFEKYCEEVRDLATKVKKKWRIVAKFSEAGQEDPSEAFIGLFSVLDTFSEEFKNSYTSDKFFIDNDGKLFFSDGENVKITNYTVHLENFDNEEYESTFYEINLDAINFLKGNMSTIFKNFGILQLEKKRCSCGNVSFKLSVDFYRTFSHFSNNINNEYQKEGVDWICGKCKKKDCTAFRRFFPLGKYFIVQNISLFNYLAYHAADPNIPLPIYLQNFETKTKNIGKNKFKNVAVEIHSGSLNYGHYWAKVKSSYNNDYYFHCDDNNNPYERMPLKYLHQSFEGNQQYLYFFEKIEEQNENLN